MLEQARLPLLVAAREKKLVQPSDECLMVLPASGVGPIPRVVGQSGSGDGDPASHAVAVRFAGHADHAALGLQDEIERRAIAIRPVLSESGDRAVDDAGIALARLLVAEPETRQRARAVVLEHDVRTLDE